VLGEKLEAGERIQRHEEAVHVALKECMDSNLRETHQQRTRPPAEKDQIASKWRRRNVRDPIVLHNPNARVR
jgi:hypothetical protein